MTDSEIIELLQMQLKTQQQNEFLQKSIESLNQNIETLTMDNRIFCQIQYSIKSLKLEVDAALTCTSNKDANFSQNQRKYP